MRRKKNSWKGTEADVGTDAVELTVMASKGSSSQQMLRERIRDNRHAALISEKSKAFLGDLRGTQVVFFFFLFLIWSAFNVWNLTTTMIRLFDKNQNTKVLTSKKAISDVYMTKDIDEKFTNFKPGVKFPRFAVVGCAQQLEGGSFKATQFRSGQPNTNPEVTCRDFDKPSRFNDYGQYPIPCCGVEIPRSLLLGLVKDKESDDDTDVTALRPISPRSAMAFSLKGVNVGFIGLFVSLIPHGSNVESSLDPAGFDSAGSSALFNDEYECTVNETKTVLSKKRTTYSALDMTVEEDKRGIVPFLSPPVVPTTMGTFFEIQSRDAIKETKILCDPAKCSNSGCSVNSLNMSWQIQFLAPFQKKHMTQIIKRNNLELPDGLGSCFGLLVSTMVVWSFFFPAKPELDPGVRRPHNCWYVIFPSWTPASTDAMSDEPEPESSEAAQEL
jgi:hypothetical protein